MGGGAPQRARVRLLAILTPSDFNFEYTFCVSLRFLQRRPHQASPPPLPSEPPRMQPRQSRVAPSLQPTGAFNAHAIAILREHIAA